MLLRELLLERISVSHYTTQLTNDVNNMAKQLAASFFNSNKNLLKTDREKFVRLLYSKLKIQLEELLSDYVSKISNTDVRVKFKKMDNGTGEYAHDDKLLYIKDKLPIDMTNMLGATYYTTVTNPTKSVAAYKGFYNEAVKNIVIIFLHEITHVIQLASSGKSYEKSYIYNKPQVQDYLKSIDLDSPKKRKKYSGDSDDIKLSRLNVILAKVLNPESDINRAVYHAQPEEIGAYSQQASTEIINSISKLSVDDKKKYIHDILDDIKNKKIEGSNIPKILKQYSNISKEYNYKIYKKFLKQLYLELVSYIDFLDS